MQLILIILTMIKTVIVLEVKFWKLHFFNVDIPLVTYRTIISKHATYSTFIINATIIYYFELFHKISPN